MSKELHNLTIIVPENDIDEIQRAAIVRAQTRLTINDARSLKAAITRAVNLWAFDSSDGGRAVREELHCDFNVSHLAEHINRRLGEMGNLRDYLLGEGIEDISIELFDHKTVTGWDFNDTLCGSV